MLYYWLMYDSLSLLLSRLQVQYQATMSYSGVNCSNLDNTYYELTSKGMISIETFTIL